MGNSETIAGTDTSECGEGLQIFVEQLLNSRLQMRGSSATEKLVTLTKQMNIGLCEPVKVN